jgi:hypothetical protein
MKKWKWLTIIVIGIFLVKNIGHYGIIVYQNQNFNQMFGFSLGLIVFGYIYYLISKLFLQS